MNNLNKSLLAVLAISLFSMTAIQSIDRLTKSQNVLGETTRATNNYMPPINDFPTPSLRLTGYPSYPTPAAGGIPCQVINTLQQQYCSGSPVPATQ